MIPEYIRAMTKKDLQIEARLYSKLIGGLSNSNRQDVIDEVARLSTAYTNILTELSTRP